MLLVMLTLEIYWKQTLAYSASHLLQWVCCWEEVTLVFSGVLGEDWRLSGLCAWSHTLKAFLPALYTCSCENWIWFMEEEIRCLWCPQKNRWSEISSLRWQSYRNVDKSLLAKLEAVPAGRASQGTGLAFSWWVPGALGGFTKCSSTSALRTGCVTWPSPVFYPDQAAFILPPCVWLLAAEGREEGHTGCCSCKVGLFDNSPKVRLLALLLSVLSASK